jgi:hypothetical protein
LRTKNRLNRVDKYQIEGSEQRNVEVEYMNPTTVVVGVAGAKDSSSGEFVVGLEMSEALRIRLKSDGPGIAKPHCIVAPHDMAGFPDIVDLEVGRVAERTAVMGIGHAYDLNLYVFFWHLAHSWNRSRTAENIVAGEVNGAQMVLAVLA